MFCAGPSCAERPATRVLTVVAHAGYRYTGALCGAVYVLALPVLVRRKALMDAGAGTGHNSSSAGQ